MMAAIVARLRAGPVQEVVPYGMARLPRPPYVVVKPEPDSLGRGRRVRVIAHFMPGQQVFLEEYVFNTLSVLLDGAALSSSHGNHNVLGSEEEYGDVVTSNDDGTISMERVFLLPSRIF